MELWQKFHGGYQIFVRSSLFSISPFPEGLHFRIEATDRHIDCAEKLLHNCERDIWFSTDRVGSLFVHNILVIRTKAFF